jgi:hypothetical protein
MSKKLLIVFLSSVFLFGCASIPVPPGINGDIFQKTQKKTMTAQISRNKTQKVTFIEGPEQKIIDHSYGNWSLIKFKDRNDNIRFRLLYKCYGLWVGHAKEINSNTILSTDLLMQDDINGFVLETGAVDLDRKLLDQSITSGLRIVLTSKGEGTVETATAEMKEAIARDDWEAVRKMGEPNQSKYENKSITIEVPTTYLKAFLAKADIIKI